MPTQTKTEAQILEPSAVEPGVVPEGEISSSLVGDELGAPVDETLSVVPEHPVSQENGPLSDPTPVLLSETLVPVQTPMVCIPQRVDLFRPDLLPRYPEDLHVEPINYRKEPAQVPEA